MTSQHALLFEADSIQAYITSSGRLSDAVAASARIDQLCGDLDDDAPPGSPWTDLLSACLQSVCEDMAAQVRFSRRGGGAFIAFFPQADLRDRVQALWSAVVPRWLPSLHFSLVAQDGASELDAAQAGMVALQAMRNQPAATMPESGPLTRLAPRTGRPAVAQVTRSGVTQWVDAAAQSQLRPSQREEVHDSLVERFCAASEESGLRWPRNLDAEGGNFPHLDNGHQELVMLHADGNGLGAVLQALGKHCRDRPQDYVEAYGAFSRAVSHATRTAAVAATQVVLLAAAQRDADRRVPARPLILGGDDLTIVLRPDVALPFTQAYLLAFEACTEAALDGPRKRYPFLPKKLTAAAGLAMVHASHPFDRALELAEALCTHTKQRTKHGTTGAAKPAPSGAMFYRQTVSLLGGWPDVLRAESTEHATGTYRYLRTVHGPYVLGDSKQSMGLPRLADLQALAELLQAAVPRGPLRQVVTLMHHDPEAAVKTWQRIWEMLDRRDMSAQATALERAFKTLGVTMPRRGLPVIDRDAATETWAVTPLADALTLMHMGSADDTEEQEVHA
jgi:hypothetical protein